VQRFGSALNLHPHIHSLLPDGLFVPGPGETLEFVELPPPTPEEVEALALKIARRLTRRIETRVAEEADLGTSGLEETAAAMQEALARSLRAPSPADQLAWADQDHQGRAHALRAQVAGFSLHAGQAVAADDREALERLCRYGLRAPFSQERLSRLADGRVVYELRRPWPNSSGVTRLVLEPRELLRRLAALVPAPGTQMIRYHGVFANRSKLRSRLPSPPPRFLPEGVEARGEAPETAASSAVAGSPAGDGSRETEPRRRRRLSWAALLHRVLFIDALSCGTCGGRRKVISLLSDPAVVKRILDHLGLPSTPPRLSLARPRLPDPRWEVGPEVFETREENGDAGAGSGREEGPRAPP
jgi:hypothetical protein